MPDCNVTLSDDLTRFVLSEVESGRYENISDVVSAALQTLEREEEKLVALQSAIDAGDASGEAEDEVFARMRAFVESSTQNNK